MNTSISASRAKIVSGCSTESRVGGLGLSQFNGTVIASFKKGSINKSENYRPVSLT